MTDSESDVSNSNVFTFQNGNNTIVSARGPNINIPNFSFRSQHASTMYMPRNFERQRYAESVSDQRSIYYRRETSPMSVHSAFDVQPRNFQHCYNGMSSQRSVFNGRSGSPVSMRSIDSNASVSASDIAFAFKNNKYNKYDMKVIKEAYHKWMKQRIRKKREKRRNIRLFLKGNKSRSGDDSGDQGSDSSVSSDDCRSVMTSYKDNMSSSRSAHINLSNFRKTVRDSNMMRDGTDNFRQNSFRNMFPVGPSNYNRSQIMNGSVASKHSNLPPTQRMIQERFQNGFMVPSQRFNQSIASTVIPEKSEKYNHQQRNKENNHVQNNRHMTNKNSEIGSEEEIFPKNTSMRQEKYSNNTVTQNKRSYESDDDTSLPDKKKSKTSSTTKKPPSNKKVSKTKNISPIKNINENSNNFEFVKPTFPVRKSRSKVQETVIAKCKQPLTGFVEPIPKIIESNIEIPPINSPEKPKNNEIQADPPELSQSSDVSMRPSFIKRKLFTQNLDVAEKANVSTDVVNSPQNVYSAIQKEKNKARKLVTNQSCMNREIQDESNLLDLIHKIVPAERMNITNQTSINQTKTGGNSSNKRDDDDRWDVTSVVSMCNENDVSDTFTDEEIFESDVKQKEAKKNKSKNTTNPKPNQKIEKISNTNMKQVKNAKKDNLPQDCKIVVGKIPNQAMQKLLNNQNINVPEPKVVKSVAESSAKTFWHTDYESEAECPTIIKRNYLKEKQLKAKEVVETPKPEIKNPVKGAQKVASNIETHVSETSRWLKNIKNMATQKNTKDTTTKKTTKNTATQKNMATPKNTKNTVAQKNTKNKTIMNKTVDDSPKFNISPLSLRSHRSSKKNNLVTLSSRWFNNTKNTTMDSTRTLNISTLSLRSHRTSKRKK